jgi:hypothetical protein
MVLELSASPKKRAQFLMAALHKRFHMLHTRSQDKQQQPTALLVGLDNIFCLDQTQIRNLGRYLARIKSRIRGLGLLIRNSRKQKDTPLELGRTSPIGHDDFFMIVGPIGRSGNRLFVRELQRLDASNNFVHVATDASRVVEREHEFIFGIDDKHGTGDRKAINGWDIWKKKEKQLADSRTK